MTEGDSTQFLYFRHDNGKFFAVYRPRDTDEVMFVYSRKDAEARLERLKRLKRPYEVTEYVIMAWPRE